MEEFLNLTFGQQWAMWRREGQDAGSTCAEDGNNLSDCPAVLTYNLPTITLQSVWFIRNNKQVELALSSPLQLWHNSAMNENDCHGLRVTIESTSDCFQFLFLLSVQFCNAERERERGCVCGLKIRFAPHTTGLIQAAAGGIKMCI